jgi:hypothetical protein
VGRIKGAKPPQRMHAAGFRKASDPGKRSPSSLSPLPPQWVYDGQHWCGRVEVTDNLFVAIDVDEKVIGRFETLRQATRALPTPGGAP